MAFLPDDNLDYPALINIGPSMGSGFFLTTSTGVWLVTAKHVLFNGSGVLHNASGGVVSYSEKFTYRISFDVNWQAALAGGDLISHPDADVSVMRVAIKQGNDFAKASGVSNVSIPQGAKLVGVSATITLNFADVGISNEAFIFGYPVSIGNQGQLEADKPLLRRGAVAGINMANRTVIVDASVYQGNSGGLVLEASGLLQTHFKCLGVVSQFVPFVERFRSLAFGTVNTSIDNSGYAIVEPAEKFMALIPAAEI